MREEWDANDVEWMVDEVKNIKDELCLDKKRIHNMEASL